ncbi:helix-turn-helix domain-containing protein [Aquimarina sp. TRL1]|uniref:helix-turn-helix domain-containing protein n=1 Tax=Aquimarina sp. (strain TRL1) TaxID=2736252 RepID=UPI001589DB87|nr:helix-turn-helix domain-containing protein [Aquimarina sp. TRL1]QKX05504.1 helix-turn-helix domain-containing protein [Aquimarina sp. TRL1]
MQSLPILDIEQFQQEGDLSSFYANNFTNHFKKNHKKILKAHKHNFYLVVMFTEGTGIHEIDFESYHIQPGSVFVMRPGQTHLWKFETAAKGYIFFHSRDFYESMGGYKSLNTFPFFLSKQNTPCIYLETSKTKEMAFLFKNIYEESLGKQVLKKQKIVSLIDLIYIELSRLVVNDNLHKALQSKNVISKILELEQLIDVHYKEKKSSKAYAEMMNISTKHLNRICKEAVGKTTTELIVERVILEAKRLLLYSGGNLNEIAWELGYYEYAHFSKFFKNNTGEAPSDFRKKYVDPGTVF